MYQNVITVTNLNNSRNTVGRKSRKKKEITNTVHNAKRMDTLLKNFTTRSIMGKNSRTVTRRSTKKRSSGGNKNTIKTKKRIALMSLKKYIITKSSLLMMHSREK